MAFMIRLPMCVCLRRLYIFLRKSNIKTKIRRGGLCALSRRLQTRSFSLNTHLYEGKYAHTKFFSVFHKTHTRTILYLSPYKYEKIPVSWFKGLGGGNDPKTTRPTINSTPIGEHNRQMIAPFIKISEITKKKKRKAIVVRANTKLLL